MLKVSSNIQIKGIREGLMVSFGDEDWDTLTSTLLNQINESPAFYQSARIVLDAGSHILSEKEILALIEALSQHEITLWAVLSTSSETEQTAQNLGLATRISKPIPKEVTEPINAVSEEKALWIQQTLRSGTRIEFSGNVIVYGDVNPGAEIMAGGSVLIWGRLRGLVHAGANGNEEAIVGALEFSPMQLRIAGKIAVSPKKNSKGKLEIAKLKDGNLIAEPWKSG